MNEPVSDLIALEHDSVDSEWSKNNSAIQRLSPILPRSAWQNQRAFLSVLTRAKQALDIAEVTSILWD